MMNPGHVLASMEVARTEQKGMQLVQDGIILASKGIMAAIDQNIPTIFKFIYSQ